MFSYLPVKKVKSEDSARVQITTRQEILNARNDWPGKVASVSLLHGKKP